MPKSLTQSFRKVFAIYSSTSKKNSMTKTSFTEAEIESIKKVFEDPNKTYEEAYAAFEIEIEKKASSSITHDPFVLAIQSAYANYQNSDPQANLKDLFEGFDEESEGHSLLENQDNLNNRESDNELQKEIGFQAFFQKLVAPLFRASHSLYQSLNTETHGEKQPFYDNKIEDIFEEWREDEDEDEFEDPSSDQNQTIEDNENTSEADGAVQKEVLKEIGLKGLFYKLVQKFPHAPNAKTYQTLITIIDENIKATAHLQKMLTIVIQPLLNGDLSRFDYEYKLLLTLLSSFILSNKPIASEYQELIEHLISRFTRQGKEALTLPFQNIILDLFSLRLKTLHTPKEIEECKQFFADIAKNNKFEFEGIPSKTASLLSGRQFFTKSAYDEKEFSAYQAFIEMLTDTMFHQKKPLEENAAIVSDLLEIGIQPLLEIKPNAAKEAALRLIGSYKSPVIMPEVERFLNFLSKTYQKSNLIPKQIFKNAIERLLLKQVELLPPAKQTDDEVVRNDQLGKIYAKYVELNGNKRDQRAFLKQLSTVAGQLTVTESTTETDYKKILFQLLHSVNGSNYYFVQQRMTSLLKAGRGKVLKIIAEFKGKSKVPHSVSELDELGNAEYANASLFLRQLANLHRKSEGLWGTSTWNDITKIVEPFFIPNVESNKVDQSFNTTSTNTTSTKTAISENQEKESLIRLLSYGLGLANYGLTSIVEPFFIPPIKVDKSLNTTSTDTTSTNITSTNTTSTKKSPVSENPPKEALIRLLGYGLANYGLTSQDDKNNIPEEWESFRRRTAWLFLALHDPFNPEDKKLIEELTKKIGDGFPDKFESMRLPARALLDSLHEIISEYDLPYNEEVVEKLFTGTIEATSDPLSQLLDLSRQFYKSERFFHALLHVWYAQKPSLDFLETLETNELNKEIVTYLIYRGLEEIEKQKKANGKVTHAEFQAFILKAYGASNHHGLEISEEYLESYFSACKTPKDYQTFIQFIFEKLPAREKVKHDKIPFEYLAKAIDRFIEESKADFLREYEKLQQDKSYRVLKDCRKSFNSQLVLENQLGHYFDEVESHFSQFKKSIDSIGNIKSNNQPEIFEEFHEEYLKLNNRINSLVQEIAVFSQETQKALSHKNKEIMEDFFENLNEINKKISQISQESQTNEKEKNNFEKSTASTSTTESTNSELEELHRKKELLLKTHETLSDYVHQETFSPLNFILDDDKLTNDSKVMLLKKTVSENNVQHYDSELIVSPIYSAIVKGTAEMLAIILEGMKNFSPEQKNSLFSKKTTKEFKNKKLELTALHSAIEVGDLKKLQLLVAAGCQLNESDMRYKTNVMPLLLFAYDLKKTDIVDYLIKSGAALNVVDDDGNSLLHRAVLNGDLDMIDRLLATRTLNVEQRDNRNCTPLWSGMFDHSVPRERRYEVIRKLVYTGMTLYTDSASFKNSMYPGSENYLHRAILEEDFIFVVWLTKSIFYKHLLHEKNNDGETPLQIAIRVGNLQIIKWLWFKVDGLDVNEVNANGCSALLTALNKKSETDPEKEKNRIRVIDFILGSDKFNMEFLKRNNGHFRLLEACVHHNGHYLGLLINKGIDPNAVNRNNDTVLHLAVSAGNFGMVQLLIEVAKISFLHSQNHQRLTPLMLVYTSQTLSKDTKTKIVNYLIEKTPDPKDVFEKRNNEGNSFFDLAVKANDLETVKKLLNVKAKNIEETKKTLMEKTSWILSSFFNATVSENSMASLAIDTGVKAASKINIADNSLNKTNPAYDTAFHLATSVEMIRYLVENSLVDIQIEANQFIKKLELDINNTILPEEKRKIVLYIAEKLFEKMLGKSHTTITTPAKLARALAPWLFRIRETYSALPDNFNTLDNASKMKILAHAIEDQDVGTIAAFLDNTTPAEVLNSGVTRIRTEFIELDGSLNTARSISNGEATIIEQGEVLRSQIDLSTKEKKDFWIKVALATKKKNLGLTFGSENDTLLLSFVKENDFEHIKQLNDGGYLSNTDECEKAYKLAYKAMYPVQATTTAQTNATSNSSESHQATEKTYNTVLGAVKNYLLPFFKTPGKYFIQRIIEKLDFKKSNDCWLMINLLREAKKIHDGSNSSTDTNPASTYALLWQLKDKNELTLAGAVFENHPSLLTELLWLSNIQPVQPVQPDSEHASITNAQAPSSLKESMYVLMMAFYNNYPSFVKNCKESIGAVLTSLASQTITTQYKIEDLIIKTLSSKETINTQLRSSLGDLYIVGDYEELIKRSKKLLIDENILQGNALAEAKTGNILVHVGCIIEAFQLGRLTQLAGAENKGYLFDHARNANNRGRYIDIVKICLKKWGIQAPEPTYVSRPSHIPGPLQSSPASSTSVTSTTADSTSSTSSHSSSSSTPPTANFST